MHVDYWGQGALFAFSKLQWRTLVGRQRRWIDGGWDEMGPGQLAAMAGMLERQVDPSCPRQRGGFSYGLLIKQL